MDNNPKETGERKKGRWDCNHSQYGDVWKCSECGTVIATPATWHGKVTGGYHNYCAVCGADMRDCLANPYAHK